MKPIKTNTGVRVRMDVRKHVPATHGWFTERCGEEVGEVELEIDMDRLARQLGNKAIGSKGKISRAHGGAIVARIINHKVTMFSERKNEHDE